MGACSSFILKNIPGTQIPWSAKASDAFFVQDMIDMSAFFLMTFVIVGIISTCIAVTLVIRGWLNARPGRWKRNARFVDWADGHALILSMQRTGNYQNAMPELKLRLQVESNLGIVYQTELCSALSFSDILRIREGGRVPVKYNRSNPHEISIARIAGSGAITIHSSKSAFRYANSAIH